jgi:hypothetical protein
MGVDGCLFEPFDLVRLRRASVLKKRLLDELAAREKLAALEALTAEIVHEIENLISLVRNAAELPADLVRRQRQTKDSLAAPALSGAAAGALT